MASEIRVNSITNRSGLGTVTFNDTGVVLSGVSTFTVSTGSASAPSISPSGDSNTGIFFPSADTIAFAEGGVEALRIDSSANIGIGTANPSQRLEVVGGEIKAGRVDSTNEGGQVSFGRATDNATGWYIDVFGNTSTPSLRFVDVSNGAVRSSIDSSGNLTLNSGNLVIGTSGKGIDFSATANSSGTMTSELLSDYEQGTWTPTLGGGGNTYTQTTSVGWYTKIGNYVFVSGVINWTAKSGTSGVTVSLPFAVNSTGTYRGGGSIGMLTNSTLISSTSIVCVQVDGNFSFFNLRFSNNSATWSSFTPNSHMGTAGEFQFSVGYHTD